MPLFRPSLQTFSHRPGQFRTCESEWGETPQAAKDKVLICRPMETGIRPGNKSCLLPLTHYTFPCCFALRMSRTRGTVAKKRKPIIRNTSTKLIKAACCWTMP